MKRVRFKGLGPIWLGRATSKERPFCCIMSRGFGDILQFCRYVALVQSAERASCRGPRGPYDDSWKLFSGSPTIGREVRAHPAHDFIDPIMSMPLAFGTTTSTVPGRTPILAPRCRIGSRCGASLLLIGSSAAPRIGVGGVGAVSADQPRPG